MRIINQSELVEKINSDTGVSITYIKQVFVSLEKQIQLELKALNEMNDSVKIRVVGFEVNGKYYPKLVVQNNLTHKKDVLENRIVPKVSFSRRSKEKINGLFQI